MSEIGILVIAFLAAQVVIAFPLCRLLARLVERATETTATATRSQDRQRHDAMTIIAQFSEKLLCDPKWIAQGHLQERAHQRSLDSVTEREAAAGQQSKPDPQPRGSRGKPASNLLETVT